MSEALFDDFDEDLGFDPKALHAKYLAERDKRLREDANEQYIEIKDEHAHLLDDPYMEIIERDALTDEVEAIVIGGGFGGLLCGARLREAGVEDLRMIERGGDFGGTWYWNRYPGAQCDIESYVYLPMLEETGFMPEKKFTPAREILAHSNRIAEKFDLYRDVCFHTSVTGTEWDDDAKRWTVFTNRGDAMRCKYLIMANGPLDKPKLPGIPGITDYKGHTFHTSRWDYDYTGGGPDGGLDKISDKRIGIIGTGATAVQCIPHLGEGAKHLYVFQRTPSSIDVRGDKPTDPDWAASLKPGWQMERLENFNNLVSGIPQKEDLVNDGWTSLIGKTIDLMKKSRKEGKTGADLGKIMQIADFQKMNEIRERAEEIVADPNVAESLKPYYRQFCKRPCFADDYLPTFNRDNVTLVDTDGKGVTRITENSIIANGEEFEVDCIVFATGFEVGTDYARRTGYDPVGKNGVKLSEHWAEGMRTMHGLHIHNFPNMFFVSTGQAGFTANFPHALLEQASHVAHIVTEANERQAQTVEVTPEAEQEWVDIIVKSARNNEQFQSECTPGYYNLEGKPSQRSMQNGSYGWGSTAFFKLLHEWREDGEMKGLTLSAG